MLRSYRVEVDAVSRHSNLHRLKLSAPAGDLCALPPCTSSQPGMNFTPSLRPIRWRQGPGAAR